MTLPGIIQGWTSSGINAPDSEYSGDGSTWYGCTMKRDGGIYYCVWREAPAGVYELKWNGAKDLHRGTMHAQSNGNVIVTAYAGAGDAQPTERHAIPGFVPLSSAARDPRVDTVIVHLAQLGQQIAQIETAQKSIGYDSFDAGDREALDWIKALRALL